MIVLYAAADANAQERSEFYHTISKQPGFRASAGIMFKRSVLYWLSSPPNVEPLHCYSTLTASGWPDLQVPMCGKQTTFISSLTALDKVKMDKLPWCLLPTSPSFTTVDAIIFTDQFIIMVQVTISDKCGTKRSDFVDIEEFIPPHIRKDRKWRHVLITNDEDNAASLRCRTAHTLSDLPKSTRIYSGVFDVGRSEITRKHMETFNKNNKHALKNNVNDNCIVGSEVSGTFLRNWGRKRPENAVRSAIPLGPKTLTFPTLIALVIVWLSSHFALA
ncbi:hypothetical protein EDB86DRAFT_2905474 [Lactarius hatsudake]|nr:hypothetical protein EDB86DRAFT_2905474 [Lactarius hatsudake]